MAIQENQLDANALAALASMRASYLNLPLHSLDPSGLYKPLFEQQQNQAQNAVQLAGQANLFNISKMQQSAELARQNQNQLFQGGQNQLQRQQELQISQANQAIQQQQANQQGQYQTGMLANDTQRNALQGQQNQNTAQFQQGTLAQDQYRTQVEAYKAQQQMAQNHLDYALKLNNQNRDLMGGYGATYLTLARQGKLTPEIVQNLANDAVNKGSMTPQDAKAFLSLPPEQQYAQATSMMMSSEKASNMMDQGIIPGTGKYMEKANEQSQQDLNNMQTSLVSLQAVREQVAAHPELFGVSGYQGLVGKGEDFLGVHNGPGSDADISKQQAGMQSLLANAKQNYYGAGPQKMKLNPTAMGFINAALPTGQEASNTEALAKLDATIEMGQATADLKQQQLQNPNMDMTSYNKRIQDIYQSHFGKNSTTDNGTPKAQGQDLEAKISAAMQANPGATRDQVVQIYKQRGLM